MGQNAKGNVSSFFLPSFPPLGNPRSRDCFQTNSYLHLTIMCIAFFCSLNSKLAFLLFILLFLLIGQFPPLYFARPVVQIQCYGDYTDSKNDNNDDKDGGADSFIQSCPSTEDRKLGGSRGQENPALPSLPRPLLSLTLPRPLTFFFSPYLGKNPKPLGHLHPGTGNKRAKVTLNDDSNVFADRAQLISGCAAVGSCVVLGCLLWHFKVDYHSIPGTHQGWSWVSLGDAGKQLLCPSHPRLVARAIGFL